MFHPARKVCFHEWRPVDKKNIAVNSIVFHSEVIIIKFRCSEEAKKSFENESKFCVLLRALEFYSLVITAMSKVFTASVFII